MDWRSRCLTSFHFQEKSDQITNCNISHKAMLYVYSLAHYLANNIIYE